MANSIPTAYLIVIITLSGLVMGSFLHCWAFRLVNHQSIIKGRSHCPDCGHPLGPLDLIPVFSFLLLKGKCRYCGCKISYRYLLSEIITPVIFLAVFYKYGLSWQSGQMIVLFCCLIVCLWTDVIEQTIFDGCLLAGIIFRLLSALYLQESLVKIIANSLIVTLPLLLLVLLLEKINQKEMMGGGDFKILFMTGLYFKAELTVIGFLIACLAGIFYGICYQKLNQGQKFFPFVPCLVTGYFLTMLLGDTILNWYISLF